MEVKPTEYLVRGNVKSINDPYYRRITVAKMKTTFQVGTGFEFIATIKRDDRDIRNFECRACSVTSFGTR